MKIFDEIRIGDGYETYVLTLTEISRLDKSGKVVAIGRDSFNRFTDAVYVKDFQNITDNEMLRITSGMNYSVVVRRLKN